MEINAKKPQYFNSKQCQFVHWSRSIYLIVCKYPLLLEFGFGITLGVYSGS